MSAIKTPFRLLFFGSSCCGKSYLAAQAILNANRCFDIPPKKIIYYAKHLDSIPKQIKHLVEGRIGFPDEEVFANPGKESLWIVMDDLQDIAMGSSVLAEAFRSSRHRNVSILLLLHNLFAQKKESREITLNATGLFLLKTCRDLSSINHLSYQLNPDKPKKLSSIYFSNVKRAFQYIYVDLNILCPDSLRYRSDIFNPLFITVFLDKDQLQELQNNGRENSESSEILSLMQPI